MNLLTMKFCVVAGVYSGRIEGQEALFASKENKPSKVMVHWKKHRSTPILTQRLFSWQQQEFYFVSLAICIIQINHLSGSVYVFRDSTAVIGNGISYFYYFV